MLGVVKESIRVWELRSGENFPLGILNERETNEWVGAGRDRKITRYQVLKSIRTKVIKVTIHVSDSDLLSQWNLFDSPAWVYNCTWRSMVIFHIMLICADTWISNLVPYFYHGNLQRNAVTCTSNITAVQVF